MSFGVRDRGGTMYDIAGMPAVDSMLSSTSRNAIMNKAVYQGLRSKVEKTVNDLLNYYLKSETYSKQEVDAMLGGISTLTIKVVAALPTTDISTTTLYFVGPQSGTNIYDQYVRVDNAWVALGTTEVDLSAYVTDSELNLAIADFLTETEINLLLDDKQDKTLTSSVTIGAETVGTVEDALEAVADVVPSTATTSNKLATLADINNVEIDVDDELSDESENPVQNKVITAALDDKVDVSSVGAANGIAELDKNSKVKSSQLPSYVDDIVEGYYFDSTHFYEEEVISGYYHDGEFYEDVSYTIPITPAVGKIYKDISTNSFYEWDADNSEYISATPTPIPGESGKIYVSLDTDTPYRWSGNAFVAIPWGLSLGETSSTAYRGDRGKAAYDHSQTTSGNPHNVTASDVGLGNVGNYKALSTVAGQELTMTERANARFNSGIFEGTTQEWTNLSSTDKAKISLVILTDE